MPNTILDDLRATMHLAHACWQTETDPVRRHELRMEYYAALQAVTEAEFRAKHPLLDGYRMIPECHQ
jgi:hypothetical protein